MKTTFTWDETTGVATCCINYNGVMIQKEAHCHEEDLDFISERTGCYIAESRAIIALLQYKKNNELRPKISVLKHAKNTIEQSKHFNAKSHDYITISKLLKDLEFELREIKLKIHMEKSYLNEYLMNKDLIYKSIRKRKQAKSE